MSSSASARTPSPDVSVSGGLPVFPRGFFFGAATASYQIEGGAGEDGRGPSIWDTYCRRPGRITGGASGDVACDHYHRWPEDIALMKDLGLDTYRFSIAWPRIQPTGTGPANTPGLDFYDRLVDALLEAGITPAATLYHWDLPQALEDTGGWRVRSTVDAFTDYTRIVAERLGDRVGRWFTLNEPFCTAFVGHAIGRHAPGTREGTPALAAAHHLLLAHGHAARILKDTTRGDVGIALNPDRLLPATHDPADLAACARAETLHNTIWLDPLLAHRYPTTETDTWGPLIQDPTWRHDGDLDIITTPLDFLGINYYRPITIAHTPHQDPDPTTRTATDIRATETWQDGVRHTAMDWPVVPSSLTDLLTDLKHRYPTLPPIVITENGSAEHGDTPGPDGRIHDTDRITYLHTHLTALTHAINNGIDIRGYYAWSLMDNFEWAHGYTKRFGLIHIDYTTQTRTPKDSYHWYHHLITHHHNTHTP
ncbi:GH1 family beta-glucosidase [Streptomyces sp. RFCAC02]|uniref:GH1 family beta-glucosidase n=1 Tax=Streptomyces sp. RFCAC02 TaxID=2499143 RepID=UPI00101EC150|nr:GH1 family beta-glucosidase [Streptomyces sp. RFCAC02]